MRRDYRRIPLPLHRLRTRRANWPVAAEERVAEVTPWLDDGDVRLYHGDALEVLRGLADGSVDCCVTSPPYWGLRDYGTGEWDGGDPDCDHDQRRREFDPNSKSARNTGAARDSLAGRVACRKCGARRVDQQVGLESTPDLFVHNMVAVFRDVRRVLADHGTCWVNLGDSYNSAASNQRNELIGGWNAGMGRSSTLAPGLKPKDLVGVPWRVAFALQADGWYLRSDIVWAKPNPMPESVTDRPTKSHEYVFLLTKRPRYWFDAEAVREPLLPSSVARGEYGHASFGKGQFNGSPSDERHQDGKQVRKVADLQNPAGRNVRSVWQIATQPYPEAHFATFPEELARRCIVAGCPERVCRECGKPSKRIVERSIDDSRPRARQNIIPPEVTKAGQGTNANGSETWGHYLRSETVGWSDCGHNAYRPGVVLDPFIGSGTVAKVARDHQRHAIGIDLNQTYLELAARRLQQLSLLNEASA